MTDNNEDKQWTNFDQEYHLPLNEKKKMDLHEYMTYLVDPTLLVLYGFNWDTL